MPVQKRHIIFQILSLVIIAFLLFKVVNSNSSIVSPKIIGTEQTAQSGVYDDVYFESLQKRGGDYYIKFSKQMEDEKLPSKCYLEDGSFNQALPETEGCFMQGRPLQEKLPPDIDVLREYKFSPKGEVLLISYPENSNGVRIPLSVSLFYDYLQKTQKPYVNFYGGVIEEPKNWGFRVILVNGEVVSIEQIYQE